MRIEPRAKMPFVLPTVRITARVNACLAGICEREGRRTSWVVRRLLFEALRARGHEVDEGDVESGYGVRRGAP